MDPGPATPIVLLTGGTSGIGRAAAIRLAERGASVLAVGRDRARGEALADTASSITFFAADLAQQSQVRTLADRVRERVPRLDVLVHNAGIATPTRETTGDGIERTLAVNHLAPYLLTHELQSVIVGWPGTDGPPGPATGSQPGAYPGRIVVTASGMHRRGTFDFEDLQFTTEYDGLAAYARSKLANVAFTLELADRLPASVTVNCFHPGFIPATGLFRDASLRTRLAVRLARLVPGVGVGEETGADRLLTVATQPAFAERSGTYFTGGGTEPPSRAARDPANRRRLWERSAALIGIDPDWPQPVAD